MRIAWSWPANDRVPVRVPRRAGSASSRPVRNAAVWSCTGGAAVDVTLMSTRDSLVAALGRNSLHIGIPRGLASGRYFRRVSDFPGTVTLGDQGVVRNGSVARRHAGLSAAL